MSGIGLNKRPEGVSVTCIFIPSFDTVLFSQLGRYRDLAFPGHGRGQTRQEADLARHHLSCSIIFLIPCCFFCTWGLVVSPELFRNSNPEPSVEAYCLNS